jgi:hypothetical protein
VTIATAKAEGWYDAPGSRWRNLPDLMLRYRSATLFVRLFAPEIAAGFQTAEEIVEMQPAVQHQSNRPVFATDAPNSKPASKSDARRKSPALENLDQAKGPSDKGASEAPVTGTLTPPGSGQGSASASLEGLKRKYSHLRALKSLIRLSSLSEEEVLAFLKASGRCEANCASLAELAKQKPDALLWVHDNWQGVNCELIRRKQSPTV